MATSTKPAAAKAAVRFEATLGALPRGKSIATAAALDLDRLPDVDGRVRLLITADDAQRLLERGIEVRLQAAVPVQPLDAALVMNDGHAQRWLEEQVEDLRRPPKEGGR